VTALLDQLNTKISFLHCRYSVLISVIICYSILSPYLFNMYSEYILRRGGFEDNIGIKIGGRTINNLRYADNTTLLTKHKEDM